jgi:threonine/homoserine/homoserine lactone efflux protein
MFPEILPVLMSVVVISLSGVMLPGPMFAVTLAKSFRSPWSGVWISLGHAVIEVPLILLIYFGFAHFFENNVVQLALSILGGGMVIWLGIGMFRARMEVVTQGKDLPYSAFTAGIITSGLNPFFLLWWATIGSLLVMRFIEFGAGGLSLFIVVHWICDLFWLSLVAVVVYKTHSLWGRKVQEWVFIASSLLLAGFGIWFMVSGIQTVV